MLKFSWIVTLICTVIAALIAFGTMFNAKSAPQEAAGFAMALAFVVIPYVFTRAVEGLTAKEWAADVKAIRKQLEKPPVEPE